MHPSDDEIKSNSWADACDEEERAVTGTVLGRPVSKEMVLPDHKGILRQPEVQKFLSNMARALSVGPMRGTLRAASGGPTPPPLRVTAETKARAPVAKASRGARRKGQRQKARGGGGGGGIGSITIAKAAEEGHKAWKFIKEYLNVEEKMFDTSVQGITCTYTGDVRNISNIAEGSDYNNRNGNSILVQRLVIRYQIQSNSAVAQIGTIPVLRFAVVRDMLQNAGADPALGNLIEVTGTSMAHLQPLLHFHDGNAAARRFRILAEVTHAIQNPFATTVATTGAGVVDILGVHNHVGELNIKVGAHTLYQSTTGADASDWVGALYLISWSNIQTNGPQLSYYSRLYFTDN